MAGDGETVEVTEFQLQNFGPVQVPVELKLWLDVAGTVPSLLISIGAEGSVVLDVGDDFDFGQFSLLTIDPSFPRGEYSFNCRLLNPSTGAEILVDENVFRVD